MASIEEVRAALLAREEKKSGKSSKSFDRSVYPLWNIPDNSEATIRFLPDADQDNLFFWVERKLIKLPFQGVKGEHDRVVNVEVPSMEMWGQSCPITAAIRPYWDDPELRKVATTYYRKISYLMQGFVTNNPLDEKEMPENPIRRFIINKQIYSRIKAGVLNTEYEEMPTHFIGGRDFVVKKSQRGGFANYDESNYRIKTRTLSETEVQAIEQFGLFNLADFLPKKPDAEEVEMIKDMFDASVTNQAFDMDKFGKSFRPKFADGSWGTNRSTPTTSAPARSVSQPEATVQESVAPAAPAAAVAPAAASDALSRLRGLTGNTDSASKPADAVNPKDIIARLRGGA